MQVEVYDTYFQSLNIRLEKIGSENNFIWQSQCIFQRKLYTPPAQHYHDIKIYHMYMYRYFYSRFTYRRCCQKLCKMEILQFLVSKWFKNRIIYIYMIYFFISWIFPTILNYLFLNLKYFFLFSSYKIQYIRSLISPFLKSDSLFFTFSFSFRLLLLSRHIFYRWPTWNSGADVDHIWSVGCSL